MFNCKMIINRLHIEDARMEIGVAINCPFDVDVSSPKARILFECDGQTRRLPPAGGQLLSPKAGGELHCGMQLYLSAGPDLLPLPAGKSGDRHH